MTPQPPAQQPRRATGAGDLPAADTTDAAGSQRLAKRYGTRKEAKFTGRIVVVVLAVMLAGALAYMVSQFQNTNHADVSAVESGGSVPADDRLQMRVDVTRDDPSRPSYCILRALDYDKNEVGRREFVVPAGGPETVRFLVDINTRTKAYAGSVYGCSTVIPSYLQVP